MIHLTRTDPARNMARFYTMALQPTLFGEWALLKEWGRIGSAGRLVSCRFASEREARPGDGRAPRSEAQERLRRRLNLTFSFCPS